MAEKYPVKGIFDGGGVATDLAEFAVGDFVGLSSGGLGFTSIAGGDLMVGAVGGGSIAKLSIGAPSTVLMISSGVPAWALITNANISSSAAIDWTKMNGALPSTMVPVPLTLAYNASGAGDAHLILDQLGVAPGAAISWKRSGAVRANAYLEPGTGELVFRNVSGTAGSETYDEAMRLYKAGQGIATPRIYARSQVGTDGYTAMHSSGGATAGYVEWWRPGPARIGYIGYGSGTSWLNMQLENGVGFLVTASDPTAAAGMRIGFDPSSNTRAHLDLSRSSGAVPEWIAFRTGAVAYDVYIGRNAGSDAFSINRWNGVGDPVEIAAFTPANSTLTVVGQVNSGRGLRTEGSVFFGTGLGIELSATPGAGYVETYNRSSSTWGSQVYGASLHTFNINNVAIVSIDAGRISSLGGVGSNGIIRSTGTAGTISGGPGAEMYWSGAASVYQSYDRTAGTYQPVIISGSNTTFYAGGAPKLTVEPGGGLVTAVPFKIWSASATDANLRFYTDDHYAVVRHGAGAGDMVMIQNATGNNVATMSSNVGMTFETTNAASWGYTFQQNSTTGYGMRIWSKNDGLPAFAILNAAQTAWALQVQGTGNVLVGAGVTSPTVHARSLGDATYGYVEASQGGPSNAGYIAWHKPGPTRLGYMGFDTANNITLNLESSNFRVSGGATLLGTTATPAGFGSPDTHVVKLWVNGLLALQNAFGYLQIGGSGLSIMLGDPVGNGGGAVPTFGTIGGSGPTGAAQAGWLKLFNYSGVAHYMPIWR